MTPVTNRQAIFARPYLVRLITTYSNYSISNWFKNFGSKFLTRTKFLTKFITNAQLIFRSPISTDNGAVRQRKKNKNPQMKTGLKSGELKPMNVTGPLWHQRASAVADPRPSAKIPHANLCSSSPSETPAAPKFTVTLRSRCQTSQIFQIQRRQILQQNTAIAALYLS